MMSKCAIDVFGKAIGFLILIKSPLPLLFQRGVFLDAYVL
jgi:hypothetical protein